VCMVELCTVVVPAAKIDVVNRKVSVNYLRLEAGGLWLHLDSTATLHTFAGVQLWLHSPMHQG
jgi:hypothetical protein